MWTGVALLATLLGSEIAHMNDEDIKNTRKKHKQYAGYVIWASGLLKVEH